jgi:mRNA-degrading endonuclease RelE of RelBE toxin-antitoxin system
MPDCSYIVRISKSFEKAMKALDKGTMAQIYRHIEYLAQSPFDCRFSKKLNGMNGLRRWKVRKWRIIYEIDPNDGIINILAVRPRAQAYEMLNRQWGGFIREYCPISL